MKYICYGDWVRSADGDEHYVSASKVQRLYNVNPSECILINLGEEEHKLRGYSQDVIDNAIKLYPRNDGNYSAPTSPQPPED